MSPEIQLTVAALPLLFLVIAVSVRPGGDRPAIRS